MLGVENHEVEACLAYDLNEEWIIGLRKYPKHSFMIPQAGAE